MTGIAVVGDIAPIAIGGTSNLGLDGVSLVLKNVGDTGLEPATPTLSR